MSSLPPGTPDPHSTPDSNIEPRLQTRRLEDAPLRWSMTHNLDRQRETPVTPAARRERKMRKFRLRVILKVVVGCVVLAALLLGVWAAGLRHAMHAALPQVDGSLRVNGLSGTVTVARDEHGVPSITADKLDDVLFAQGFVTAQDRLFQMDGLRRHAAGELAEILGSKFVRHDRVQRTLQVRAAADRALAVLPADQLHGLEAYARGVNAFIAQNADHLPVEFRLLRYTPAPWTPRDSLLVGLAMSQDLSTEYPTKLMRESFAAHMPAELLADLYPVGSWRDHPPAQAQPDMTSPRPEIEQIPLDDSQSKVESPGASASDLLQARADVSLLECEGCKSGSNNWAVAGSRTASGLPLVSNDMHLGLGVPGIWYEAALHVSGGSLDVTGLTLPGLPYVIVGRNAHVAWGFTNLSADLQDVYIEHTRGEGDSLEYQRADGSWQRAGHHAEHIRVRGGSDVTVDVVTTTHAVGNATIETPVISALYPTEHRTLSLAWTIYDPATVSYPFAGVNTASDGAALVQVLGQLRVLALSVAYADDQNHIGFHAVGAVPVRGPMVKHPVVKQNAQPEDQGPPPSETEEDGASVDVKPTFTPAAFHPVRRRARAAVEQKPLPKVEEDPIAPLPQAPDYTIGSPIPAVPVDALNADAQWSGYVPYDELPAVVDPMTGFVATANARVAPDGYPYAITLNWAGPYRAERITRVLTDTHGATPADMLRLQTDVYSNFDQTIAQRMAYAIDHASKPSTRVRQAADVLRAWNGEVAVNAAAPQIVVATRAELMSMLLTAQIAAHDGGKAKEKPETVAQMYAWGEQGYALEMLLQHQPARWLPRGYASWNDLIAAAVERAIAHAPSKLADWSYSKAHPVELDHALLSATPLIDWLLGIHAGSGPRVIAGDSSCVKATSRAFGPSERFTADLANADATTSNITTGESGNPASGWYLDQLPHWLAGTTLPLPLHTTAAKHTLTLTP